MFTQIPRVEHSFLGLGGALDVNPTPPQAWAHVDPDRCYSLWAHSHCYSSSLLLQFISPGDPQAARGLGLASPCFPMCRDGSLWACHLSFQSEFGTPAGALSLTEPPKWST